MRACKLSALLAAAILLACLVSIASGYAQQKKWERLYREASWNHRRIPATELSDTQQKWLVGASKSMVNGWLFVNISGDAYTRGFQHGYLVVEEFMTALNAYSYYTVQTTGMPLQFFFDLGVKYHASKVPVEQLDEMQGIADGLVAGGANISLSDIIGWNSYMEITGYFDWMAEVPSESRGKHSVSKRVSSAHCSAFAATGSATADGRPVIGHQTFIEFAFGSYVNMILSITPTTGYAMIMQSSPGWIASMTDFYVQSGGLAITETTIAGYAGYNKDGTPEYARVRNATQYSSSIGEWIAGMQIGNNGGYANSWILADMKTNEIAEFEQGLIYQYTNVQTEGYIFGENAANSPQIRNLECTDTGYSDTRQQTGARRVRWPQLLDTYSGNITLDIGTIMLGDTYDPYLNKENPSSRCICGMYDVDPFYYASDPNAVWNVPFYPAGSIDGKLTSADLADQMALYAIYGRANGVPFDVESFLDLNPAWAWQGPILLNRPSQPWTVFAAQA